MMKWGKLLIGTALAICCYGTCMASSLDEALAVTSDKDVAYTFYLGMDTNEIKKAMNGLNDWKRVDGGLSYTRTLEDGTVQDMWFTSNSDGSLHEFQIIFKTQTPGEAVKMFYKARSQLKDKYGSPERHTQDSDSEVIEYKLGNKDDAIHLDYSRKDKIFGIKRIQQDFNRIQESAVRKYGKCKR